jgi:hypothetical protein
MAHPEKNNGITKKPTYDAREVRARGWSMHSDWVGRPRFLFSSAQLAICVDGCSGMLAGNVGWSVSRSACWLSGGTIPGPAPLGCIPSVFLCGSSSGVCGLFLSHVITRDVCNHNFLTSQAPIHWFLDLGLGERAACFLYAKGSKRY